MSISRVAPFCLGEVRILWGSLPGFVSVVKAVVSPLVADGTNRHLRASALSTQAVLALPHVTRIWIHSLPSHVRSPSLRWLLSVR